MVVNTTIECSWPLKIRCLYLVCRTAHSESSAAEKQSHHMQPLPLPDLTALLAIAEQSGLINPERFQIEGSGPKPGTLHPLTPEQRKNFPIDIGILVLAVKDDHVVICPAVIPPARDRELLDSDRWLPEAHSPFRTLPGTGRMQVRYAWQAKVPIQNLPAALLQMPLGELRMEVPEGVDAHDWIEDWHEAWNNLTQELSGI